MGVVNLVDIILAIWQQTQITEHLVWQIGKGLPKMLPQCLLKNSIGSDLNLAI